MSGERDDCGSIRQPLLHQLSNLWARQEGRNVASHATRSVFEPLRASPFIWRHRILGVAGQFSMRVLHLSLQFRWMGGGISQKTNRASFR